MGNLIHPPLCQCDQCRTAHKRKDQAGATVVHQFVTTIQTLKQELLLREAQYRIADTDRRDLLQMLAPLATAYHERGVEIQKTFSDYAGETPHADNIAECEDPLCLLTRKGLEGLGKSRDGASEMVQAAIDEGGPS